MSTTSSTTPTPGERLSDSSLRHRYRIEHCPTARMDVLEPHGRGAARPPHHPGLAAGVRAYAVLPLLAQSDTQPDRGADRRLSSRAGTSSPERRALAQRRERLRAPKNRRGDRLRPSARTPELTQTLRPDCGAVRSAVAANLLKPQRPGLGPRGLYVCEGSTFPTASSPSAANRLVPEYEHLAVEVEVDLLAAFQ